MSNIKLEAPPPSNLVQNIGTLKRDPGIFSGWRETTVCITKDYFLHIYPETQKDNTDFDWSRPHITINIHQIKLIENKVEDMKMVIHQHKPTFKPVKPNKKEIKADNLNMKLIESTGAFT